MLLFRHRWIDREEFAAIVNNYVEFYNDEIRKGGEGIPPLSPTVLDQVGSIVESLNETYFGRPLFFDFAEKAAAAYHSINKGHYFPNGNKRLATYVLLYLLRLNGYTLPWNEHELVDLALRVAKSRGTSRSRAYWIRRVAHELRTEAQYWTERFDDDF